MPASARSILARWTDAPRLTVTMRSPAALDLPTRVAAFALLRRANPAADRARFERDLAGMHHVVLLRDRRHGTLRGFATVLVHDLPAADGRWDATVVLSGDTVIDRADRADAEVQRALLRLLVDLRLGAPRRPLRWSLTEAGWRAYRRLLGGRPRAELRWWDLARLALRCAAARLARRARSDPRPSA